MQGRQHLPIRGRLVHQNSPAIPVQRHNRHGLRGLLWRRGGKHAHQRLDELRRNKHVFQRRLRLVKLGRDWGLAGRKIRIRLGSTIPGLESISSILQHNNQALILDHFVLLQEARRPIHSCKNALCVDEY